MALMMQIIILPSLVLIGLLQVEICILFVMSYNSCKFIKFMEGSSSRYVTTVTSLLTKDILIVKSENVSSKI